MLTKVVIAHVDKLGVWRVSQKSGKFKCTRVIPKNRAIHVGLHIDNIKFMLPHFGDKFHEGNDVMEGHRHGYVLHFGHGERNLGLQLGGPDDWAGCIKYNPSTPRLCGTTVKPGS